eukprot:6191047-Pleurochrysis_carterae.AAC.2
MKGRRGRRAELDLSSSRPGPGKASGLDMRFDVMFQHTGETSSPMERGGVGAQRGEYIATTLRRKVAEQAGARQRRGQHE